MLACTHLQDLPLGYMDDLYEWMRKFPQRIDEMEDVLTENRIWKMRTQVCAGCGRCM